MNVIRHFVVHNFWLKVISIVLAVLLWAAVAHEPVIEVVRSVPIEFRNTPENLEIASERIPEVQVRVRGPMGTVRQLLPSEVHVVLSLESAQQGERTYDLNPSRVVVPDTVGVVQIVPSQFRVSLDRRASRQVEVHPRITGSFASGYRIEEVVAAPRVVTIAGPEQHVQQIEGAITDPIDATGVVGRATFNATPYVTDPMVRVVSPSSIRVTVATGRGR